MKIKETFYNEAYDIEVPIYEYEVICSMCKGRGIVDTCFYYEEIYCPLCDGRGKIDWIDKIKKENSDNVNEVRRILKG